MFSSKLTFFYFDGQNNPNYCCSFSTITSQTVPHTQTHPHALKTKETNFGNADLKPRMFQNDLSRICYPA